MALPNLRMIFSSFRTEEEERLYSRRAFINFMGKALLFIINLNNGGFIVSCVVFNLIAKSRLRPIFHGQVKLLSTEDTRLLIISNRLPITIRRKGKDEYEFSMSSGGLVSALSGLKKSICFSWIGWPGVEVPESEQKYVISRLQEEYNAVPVFMDNDLADRHYNGFSNSILWPLFHYHPDEIRFDEPTWEAYREANRRFAKLICSIIQEGDLIWVQDYHLMLLPAMLREKIDERILPVRNEILHGVLHSDLIGFHTYDYARHFLSSCSRILNLHTLPNGVEFNGKLVNVGAFPIGIDPDKFTEGLKQPKIIVGVDRLDYIKGVPQKLHALEFFLTEHPEWIGKVVLVQVAVPSRQDVEEYQNLRAIVNELVGRINGKFGTIEFMPIHFMHKSISFDELIALYAVSDICLVSSTRDGMNLVSYEYICAAQSLNGSIIVNPWNVTELAGAIYDAITMPEDLRKSNHEKLYRYVNKYTSSFWGQSFVNELKRISLLSKKTVDSVVNSLVYTLGLYLRQRENIKNEVLDLKELYRQIYIDRIAAIESERRGDICQAILSYQSILKVVEKNSHILKKPPIWSCKKSEKQIIEVVKMYVSQAELKIPILGIFTKLDPNLFLLVNNNNHINNNVSSDFYPSKNINYASKEISECYSFPERNQRLSNFQKEDDIFRQSLRISDPNKNLFLENIFKNKNPKQELSKDDFSHVRRTSQHKQFPQTLRQTKSRSSLIHNNAERAASYSRNSGTNSTIRPQKKYETNTNFSQRFIDSTIQLCSSLFSTSCRSSLHESYTSKAFPAPNDFKLNNLFNSQYIDKNNITDELSNSIFKQSVSSKASASISQNPSYFQDLNLDAKSQSDIQANISPITIQKSLKENASLLSLSQDKHREKYINLDSVRNQKCQNEMTFISNTLKNTSLEPESTKIQYINTKETREQKAINNLKGIIDENLLQIIVNDIVVKGDKVSWDDIAGLEDAKKTLKETVIYPLLRPDLFNGLREPATGVLLFGPPGTGKTMLAKAAATQAKSTFFSISASSLTSKFLGESEKLVRALFSLAKELSPSIIFVDEIDALLSSRREDGNEHEASRRLKTEFLIQWSSLAKAVVSNDESEPISRVLAKRQYIPLPERDTRMQQILHLLRYQTHTLSNEDINNLVDITEGYSGSDITALTKDAAMGPLRCLGEALLTAKQDLIRPINLDDFKASLRLIRPSVSQKRLIEFEKFNREFGIQS
ncbi:hypothetical protein MERGE_001781 [Pneumocystis wakefieldiae]|uniref:AAA+ ATPase domain-containing protein n=1 Tax=Pneumocystis wakefieldiae TaxID=38082 RepID=A0A899FKB2_9ASCO|nr:hypothetical protein MERGE_001781 [Pneumocystis wakefieldiae]